MRGRERTYIGMRCGPPFCADDCQCRFDRAWEAEKVRLKYNKNVFVFCSYWRTWSRVLTPYVKGTVVELNLTPVNSHYAESWERDVAPIIFRSHGTSLDRADQLTEQLPEKVREFMVANIGEALTERLLVTDWLPLLDRSAVDRGRPGGGGIPLAECMK